MLQILCHIHNLRNTSYVCVHVCVIERETLWYSLLANEEIQDLWHLLGIYTSFPGSSAGKESACNTEDLSWIPGLGRSAGEGIGHPLQYSLASLVAQLVKNPSAMWETWVQSLGWEGPLENGHLLQYSGLENSGVTKNRTWLSHFHFQECIHTLSLAARGWCEKRQVWKTEISLES